MSNSSSELDTNSQDNSCFYCDKNPCTAVSFEQFCFHTEEIFDVFRNFVRLEETNYEVEEVVAMLDNVQRSKARGRLYYKFCEWSVYQMKKGLRHELPTCITHMLRSYIPSTDGLYKGYTTVASMTENKARALTIDDIIDDNHYWMKTKGKWGLFNSNDVFIRY